MLVFIPNTRHLLGRAIYISGCCVVWEGKNWIICSPKKKNEWGKWKVNEKNLNIVLKCNNKYSKCYIPSVLTTQVEKLKLFPCRRQWVGFWHMILVPHAASFNSHRVVYSASPKEEPCNSPDRASPKVGHIALMVCLRSAASASQQGYVTAGNRSERTLNTTRLHTVCP